MLYAVLKPPRQERRMSMLKRVLREGGEEARRGCLQLLVLAMAEKRGWRANYRDLGGIMMMRRWGRRPGPVFMCVKGVWRQDAGGGRREAKV